MHGAAASSTGPNPSCPAGKLIHAILDNYAAHKHPKVRAWLTSHPRPTFHSTPTSLLLDQCGRDLFATLTPNCISK